MTRKTVLFLAMPAILAAAAGAGYYAYQHREPRFAMRSTEAYYRQLKVPAAQPVDAAAVRAGVVAATGYLKAHSLPSGQFVYLVNPNPAVTIAPSYNLLRHAGAIYALALSDAVVYDPDAQALMQRATKFMRECCFAEVDGHGLGLWEPEALTHTPGPRAYKLGGVGLAIVALARTEAVAPGSATAREMQEFARFGRYLMKWNGTFLPRYVPEKGWRQPSGDVLFYPGEMVLGWMALYEQHPSPELMKWSVDGLMALARERAAAGEAPADHWSLLATADLLRLAARDRVDVPHEVLVQHAAMICHQILEEGYGPPAMAVMDGQLLPQGDVVGTAARLEGLQAALTFLPADHPLVPHIRAAVHRGIAFLLRAQVKDGPYAGGMPLNITTLPGRSAATLDFNQHATEIRVDHLQHSLSAMSRYLALRQAGVL